MPLINVKDSAIGGSTDHEFDLDVLDEHLTVRQLIRSRVHQEVKDFNASHADCFRGLVQPKGAERTLDGFKLRMRRPIDWHEQYERAVEAFERGSILVLVDDRQVRDLDEEVLLRVGSVVQFLRLVPLIGG